MRQCDIAFTEKGEPTAPRGRHMKKQAKTTMNQKAWNANIDGSGHAANSNI